jgi:hypothetical protein
MRFVYYKGKGPLPRILAAVITGSNNMYKADIKESISGENPSCDSRMGSITMIPPPGIAATENFAITK